MRARVQRPKLPDLLPMNITPDPLSSAASGGPYSIIDTLLARLRGRGRAPAVTGAFGGSKNRRGGPKIPKDWRICRHSVLDANGDQGRGKTEAKDM